MVRVAAAASVLGLGSDADHLFPAVFRWKPGLGLVSEVPAGGQVCSSSRVLLLLNTNML